MVLTVFKAFYGASGSKKAGDVTLCCLCLQADFLGCSKIIAS